MVQLLVAGLAVGSGYALVALGMHIIVRTTRVVNFAQGEFVIIGGLIAFTFSSTLHWSPWLVLAGTTIAGFALGVAFECVVLRAASRSGETAQTVATIGTIFILLYGHALVPGWGSVPQPLVAFSGSASDTIAFGGTSLPVGHVWIVVLFAAVLAVLTLFFERTTFGKAMRAVASDPLGARLVGINVAQMRSLSVGIAIALAAFGGTILGPVTLVGGAGGIALAMKGFVGAIIGGFNSPLGCATGGLAIGIVEKLFQAAWGYGIADPLVYTLFLVMLVVRPQGMIGTRAALRG